MNNIGEAILDKNNPTPLYFQVQKILEARIEEGQWLPGTQLPSERELCEEFDVSRITIRQALAALTNQGRLVRRQGIGTFVASPRIEQQLGPLTGFTQEVEARGQQPGARVLRQEVISAPAAAARALSLEPDAPVTLIQRQRLVDDEPLALETAHLPVHRFPDLANFPLENRSLYSTLASRYLLQPSRAEQQIQAVACPAVEARLLDVPVSTPVLHMFRITLDLDRQPFEYTESYYRGDRYVFHATLIAGEENRK